MHCPRCGTKLTIYEEWMGTKWLYRMYPCSICKVIWDWSSKIIGDGYWKMEECRAWDLVGVEILSGYYNTSKVRTNE